MKSIKIPNEPYGLEIKPITSQLEEIKAEICDHYCKYPEKPIPEGKTEDWL